MRMVLVHIMTASVITSRSSKADIIQSAEELIGDMDEKLSTEKRLAYNLKEERNSVACLLVATSVFHLLF